MKDSAVSEIIEMALKIILAKELKLEINISVENLN